MLLIATWPIRPWPISTLLPCGALPPSIAATSLSRGSREPWRALEFGLLDSHHRRQFRKYHLADGHLIFLSLHMRLNLARLVFSQSCSVFFLVVSAGCGSFR